VPGATQEPEEKEKREVVKKELELTMKNPSFAIYTLYRYKKLNNLRNRFNVLTMIQQSEEEKWKVCKV
jgi:hypothetical protein